MTTRIRMTGLFSMLCTGISSHQSSQRVNVKIYMEICCYRLHATSKIFSYGRDKGRRKIKDDFSLPPFGSTQLSYLIPPSAHLCP